MSSTVLSPAKKLDAQHIRMARVGLNLSIRELAQLSDMNKATIVRIEAGYPVRESSLSSVRETLESKGAMFWRCQKINKVLISVDNTEVL